MSNAELHILTVDGLGVRCGAVQAVLDFSMTVDKGQILGIVGESGSGKSSLLRSIAGLLGQGACISAGEIHVAGREVSGLSRRELAAMRGSQVAYVFQDPVSSLDPLFNIGDQFRECLGTKGKSLPAAVMESLAEMGFDDPERVLASYPHQLSGGMCQRVVLAMAAALSPCLLLADEPTSALDTVSQAGVLAALRRLRDEGNMGIVLVSHDIDVVRAVSDVVGVMKDGVLVESGPTAQVLEHPAHPYTRRLLDAVPTGDGMLLNRGESHVARA